MDAVSGAGAGGSVVLVSGFISTTQTVTAIGGRGGNQIISASEFEGPGGGGSGGYIAATFGPLTTNVSGGANGTTNSSLMAAFPSNGATAAASGQFLINAIPFIAYNPNSILNVSSNSPLCAGNTLSLTVGTLSGAVYSWAGPNGFSSIQQNPVIPNVQTTAGGTYSLAVAVAGCSNLATTIPVTVHPNPALTVGGATVICAGQTTTLTASGANTYTWNTMSTSPAIMISPTISTTYTVSGTSSFGCSSSTTVQVMVDDCTGVDEMNSEVLTAKVYPNPANDLFYIEYSENDEFTSKLFNALGQLVYVKAGNKNKLCIDVKNFHKGIYYLEINTDKKQSTKRIVIE